MTQTVDSQVHALIERFARGSLTEREVRREIAAVIYQSEIIERVVSAVVYRLSLSDQLRVDLADRLTLSIMEKVLEEGSTFFCLDKAAGSSAAGWTRQTARSMLKSTMRDSARAGTRNGTPTGLVDNEPSPLLAAAPSALQRYLEGEMETILEEYLLATRSRRDSDREQIAAVSLCQGMSAVPAIRPDSMSDRDDILRAFENDHRLARRSLRAWYETVHGSGGPVPGDVTTAMLALWDDQTEDSAHALLQRPDSWPHMLACAAVAPKPRPSFKFVQSTRARIAEEHSMSSSDRPLVHALVDSYIDAEHEATSGYSTMSEEDQKAITKGWQLSRNKLHKLAAQAARIPGSPLGSTPGQVLATIERWAGQDALCGIDQTAA
ncbi:MAG: hypothetical protein ACRCYU_23400 [Nocardioides sp.]